MGTALPERAGCGSWRLARGSRDGLDSREEVRHINGMRFAWTPRNTEKVERHGLTREIVEAVFSAEDFRSTPDPGSYRRIGEGTVGGGVSSGSSSQSRDRTRPIR